MIIDCIKSFSIKSYSCMAGNTAATMIMIVTINSIIMKSSSFSLCESTTHFAKTKKKGRLTKEADLQEKHRRFPCYTGNAVGNRVKPNDLVGVRKCFSTSLLPLSLLGFADFLCLFAALFEL